MFTGLVEARGQVKSVDRTREDDGLMFKIKAPQILDGVKLGDSIAVNGVCLTVTGLDGESFIADVMNETINKTSLASLEDGSLVNLERALCLNSRLGGHLVSGHVDGMGEIVEIKPDGISNWFTIQTSQQIMDLIIPKGSITIDGVSLTVADLDEDLKQFKVSIIPHTKNVTLFDTYRVSDKVNLENDLIGKYVQKLYKKENNICTTQQ